MSDEEAEEIRVGLQNLVDIIFDKWRGDRKSKNYKLDKKPK